MLSITHELMNISAGPLAYKNPHASQDLLPNLSEIRHKKVSVNSELSCALYNHALPFHK